MEYEVCMKTLFENKIHRCEDCVFIGLNKQLEYFCALNHNLHSWHCTDWFYRPTIYEGGLNGIMLKYARMRLEEVKD